MITNTQGFFESCFNNKMRRHSYFFKDYANCSLKDALQVAIIMQLNGFAQGSS